MRPPMAVLSPDLLIAAALRQMKDGGFDVWPVVDEDGLLGMIRISELEQAADQGMSYRKVAEILSEGAQSGHSTAEESPHLHLDHSLSLALERMGTSGLNVLPVVSRANVRELLGIIALEDILETYGVPKQGRPKEQRE
jgi:CBS domain-containing protein